MESIQISGKTYRINQRQELAPYPHLAADQPDVLAWVFADCEGRPYVIRELKNGSYSNPKRL